MSFSLYIDYSGLVEGLEKHVCLTDLHEKIPGSERVFDTRTLEKGSLILGFMDDTLCLRRAGDKEKPVFVDFVGGKAGHRRKFGGGKGQDIAKAVGLNKGVTPHVLDGTGGLGRDAFVLASLGCTVTLIERSPVIAALLQDGINRAKQNPEVADIASRMTLINDDSRQAMQDLATDGRQFDVVYLDPMFPHREKSALVKKEMRIFQDLLSGDPDADELLAPAESLAEFRVVVKRPRLAPDLAGKEPTYRLEGKACRYDIHAYKAFGSEK
ncbi:16S rRNA methyltransferase [Endozoicomonas montiporae]|uniref:Ribosomal RNA small subunit methyltransferase J n=2 Tax=Endozoicomonas montiporae TaxID=1027273 RepID=A0A081N452_9GAMM|nr:class I SAM-dependent methyltransferase [Endozoicomonas montiporae]AMO57941.1 16S rRNA (guanine1516-N2)-methyltransferase [Endozoicomonas montiporae CL-33]KEQ13225.1 16S rRNA methyltransferase [Endozoicomonas montiporae]